MESQTDALVLGRDFDVSHQGVLRQEEQESRKRGFIQPDPFKLMLIGDGELQPNRLPAARADCGRPRAAQLPRCYITEIQSFSGVHIEQTMVELKMPEASQWPVC